MHEASLAISLIELAQTTLERYGLRRALVLQVEMSALSMVDAQALATAFDCAKQGTACAEAKLFVREAPARLVCPQCEAYVCIGHRTQPCPMCAYDSGWNAVGDGFILKTIEAD